MSRPITLSTRLMLTLGGSLLALALAIGITAHQGMARILDSALNDKAHSLARQLGIVATDALLIYDYGTLERYVEDLAATPNIRYLEVRSAAGELLAHAGAQDRQQGHNIVRVHQPIAAANSILGEVVLGYDRSSVPATLNRLMTWLVGGLVVLMGVMFWLMRRTMERSIVRPIQTLAESYNPLRGGAYPDDKRLPGELARLASTFSRLRQDVHDHIAARQESEELARSALARLLHEQRLATVGQMAAGLAHSLNTPLGNILGHSQLGVRDANDKTRTRLKTIAQQTRHCSEIVSNLLTAARPPETKPRPTDVSSLVEHTVRLTAPVLRQRGLVTIHVQAESGCIAMADPAGLEQILFNLLTNAVQAGAGTATITVEDLADRCRLVVSDDGSGITASVRDRLFDPFVTSKAPGEGSGLGLYLSKTLANAMHGDLRVASTGAGGTTFMIELEAHDGESTA